MRICLSRAMYRWARWRSPRGSTVSRLARLVLYGVAGGLFGFLFLAEMGLSTSAPLEIFLLLLAVASLVGALRAMQGLSAWAAFCAAAMIVPLMVDSRVVGLPRCSAVAADVACFGGSRDYQTPFWLELAVFTVAAAAVAIDLRRTAQAEGPCVAGSSPGVHTHAAALSPTVPGGARGS